METSDHSAIQTDITISSDANQGPSSRKRLELHDYLKTSFHNFVTDWYFNYKPCNTESFYSDLIHVINEFFLHVETDKHHKSKGKRKLSQITHYYNDPKLDTFRALVYEAGSLFRTNRTPENLKRFQEALKLFREKKGEKRQKYWFDFVNSINNHTSIKQMWSKINKARGKTTQSIRHHNPQLKAECLVNQWSKTSSYGNLSTEIKESLDSHKIDRGFQLEIAMNEYDICDNVPITALELSNALKKGTATSPGEDGITYDIIRALAEIPGNPVLQLFNMSLEEGTLPLAWTKSIIIPIPKPKSDQYRPISLTSCFCKVLERILLNRLLFRIRDILSPRLNGFLSGRSVNHCINSYLANTDGKTFTAFIDLKSAFDIANREVILDQLIQMGIKGKLLTWIKGYLSNRKSQVFYQGFLSSEKSFELGTPQGGVLSPTLFNVLLHALLNNIHTRHDELLISYADDIMIQTHCKARLQKLLNDFNESAVKCGLVISYAKTKVVVTGTKGAAFSINHNKLETVSRVRYLGLQVPAGGTVPLEEIKSACMARLGPLKAIASSTFGANIKIMKDFYIAFIRSVIDYAAPVLINYSHKQMEKLEKIQNSAMRIILGCPMQTRVVNMRKELNLCTLYERVHMLNAVSAIKVLRENRSTLLQKRIYDGLQNVSSIKNQWLKITCLDLNFLNVDFSAKITPAAPCPWTEQTFAITIPELEEEEEKKKKKKKKKINKINK